MPSILSLFLADAIHLCAFDGWGVGFGSDCLPCRGRRRSQQAPTPRLQLARTTSWWVAGTWVLILEYDLLHPSLKADSQHPHQVHRWSLNSQNGTLSYLLRRPASHRNGQLRGTQHHPAAHRSRMGSVNRLLSNFSQCFKSGSSPLSITTQPGSSGAVRSSIRSNRTHQPRPTSRSEPIPRTLQIRQHLVGVIARFVQIVR